MEGPFPADCAELRASSCCGGLWLQGAGQELLGGRRLHTLSSCKGFCLLIVLMFFKMGVCRQKTYLSQKSKPKKGYVLASKMFYRQIIACCHPLVYKTRVFLFFLLLNLP